MFEKIKTFIKKITTNPVPSLPKIYGTHGRLEIPNLVISLPLYNADGNAQKFVDQKNAAVFIKWPGQNVIADHSGQDGFERLAHVVPGNTLAYICYNDGTPQETYLCTKKQIGHILITPTKNKLVDNIGNFPKSDGLIIYTCIDKSQVNVMDVWLTYWKKQ